MTKTQSGGLVNYLERHAPNEHGNKAAEVEAGRVLVAFYDMLTSGKKTFESVYFYNGGALCD